nr:TSUP family transporter [Brevundimonas vesicularis]
MIEFAPEILLLLFAAAVTAGFVDAIAGGGGLITVPALLAVGVNPVAAIATNKI